MASQYGWALSDFEGSSESNQLSFSRGDLLIVTNQLEGGWWFGTTKDGNNGYFPESYVKLHDPANGETNMVPEPTRPAPAAPSTTSVTTTTATTTKTREELTAQSDWVAVFDERYDRYYYTNRRTKESTWEKPEGSVVPKNSDGSSNTTTNKKDSTSTTATSSTTLTAKGGRTKESRRTKVIKDQKKERTILTKQPTMIVSDSDSYHLGIPIENDISEEEVEENDGDSNQGSDGGDASSSNHEGDHVQPTLINYKSFSTKLKAHQNGNNTSSYKSINNLPQGWLHRLKKSKSAFSSNPFKREYFIVVPKDKHGDLVLCRYKKEPTKLIADSTTTPLQYQNESYEVYDLVKASTGISVSPESTGVKHVFHVMEKNAVASMVLAADTKSDCDKWVHTLREILRIGRARNIEMPEDDKTLDRLFKLVLKNLALPKKKQIEMLNTMKRNQKWQLIQMHKANLNSQALASAIQGTSTTNSGRPVSINLQVEKDAIKWANRTINNKNSEMHTLKGILALKTVVATSGLHWLKSFHKNGGITGLFKILKYLGNMS